MLHVQSLVAQCVGTNIYYSSGRIALNKPKPGVAETERPFFAVQKMALKDDGVVEFKSSVHRARLG